MSRMDPIARGLAAQARTAALPLTTRALGNVGTRIFAGRIGNTKAVVTTGTTYEVLLATAAPFDLVRVILSVSQTGSNDAVSPRAIVTGGAVAGKTDSTVSAVVPTTFTFAGAYSVTLAPRRARAAACSSCRTGSRCRRSRAATAARCRCWSCAAYSTMSPATP